jgi:predicted metal-dependent hydrolase
MIEYKVIRKKSNKHTYLSVKDGQVEVRANTSILDHEIEAFVQSKQEWIEQRLMHTKPVMNADEYYFLGKVYSKYSQDDGSDWFYKEKAVEVLIPLVNEWSKKMQLFPTKLGFRKNKTRWGSCNGQNALSFNTQLLKLPIEVIVYVVIHELAHIKHKNHSSHFWKEVETFCPDFKTHKKRLRSFEKML